MINFLSLKLAEFYLRGISKVSDEWLEVFFFQNNGEYNID